MTKSGIDLDEFRVLLEAIHARSDRPAFGADTSEFKNWYYQCVKDLVERVKLYKATIEDAQRREADRKVAISGYRVPPDAAGVFGPKDNYTMPKAASDVVTEGHKEPLNKGGTSSLVATEAVPPQAAPEKQESPGPLHEQGRYSF